MAGPFVYLSLAEQAVNLLLHLAGVFLLVDALILLSIAFVAVAYQNAVADATRTLLARRADRRWPDARLDLSSLAHLLCLAALVIARITQLVMPNRALLAFRASLALVARVVFRMRTTSRLCHFLIARLAIAAILTRPWPLATS